MMKSSWDPFWLLCFFVFVVFFFIKVELFEKDMEYIQTELDNVYAADTSPISLYEYFHISPIKVCTINIMYVCS